jgi:polysaccharide pyruvyl transferase WcaK-like protein
LHEDSLAAGEISASFFSFVTTEEVSSQVAVTHVVVASRFYNVLLALILGQPVIASSYRQKFRALMARMGLSEFCHNIEKIEINKLVEQ